MDVVVDGWYCETHNGDECRFVCVQYDHFGFSLNEKQVTELARKITSLLAEDEFITAPDELLHVDWNNSISNWVMIAFRPCKDCQSHYYDIPKDMARQLAQKLQGKLGAAAEFATFERAHTSSHRLTARIMPNGETCR